MTHLLSLSTLLVGLSLFSLQGAAADEPFVPGTGVKVKQVGDNFEDPRWGYIMNGRKASYEQDEQQRPPGGKSRNGRWYESAMRGQPDVIKRVPTPPGGIAGSTGAMMMATRLSGIPGELAGTQMQDDLLMGVATRIGRAVPVRWSPSCTTRVYLPPFEKWENRTGASFGIRADVRGRERDGKVDAFWPGFFILFRSETDKRFNQDFAQISIRAQPSGRDKAGPKIYQHGWWTFGMSFTPDGQVHYYASEGVDDLTEEDHLYSSFPYGTRSLMFDNFFYNVANWENGKNWSTPWVVDDPEFFVIPPEGMTLANLIRTGRGSLARRPNTRTAGKPANKFKKSWKRLF
ncbi:MAG: hypothetical protein MI725_17115 [Pirellulales bacterium]|nr:hypothetical protein [Pirellulales bacterium]